MNNYKKLNNLLGWAVFLISSIVYILTSEPTMSFWDCGEYIATAYKLEVGHPPGAPLFQMIGRFFTLFAFGDVTLVARMINTMSALASGFTILFLFWTITMIARKILTRDGGELTESKTLSIMGAGLVGALAYTFTDSFWFSAVEGEVYAMSSFFTAVVFWAIFKWEEQAEEKHAARWIVLIAYLIGLSIGVHLLNLLAIPAITMVFYFKKYPGRSWKGVVLALLLSVLILAVVMYIVIPWILKLAGMSELLFVNSFGLPFNSGTAVYFLLLVALITWGLLYTRRNGKTVLNTILLSLTFILIGYTTFLMLVIRSNAQPPINENSPKNAMDLLSYLNREQYGDWPILYGQYFNAPQIDRKDGNPVYMKDVKSGKYIVADTREKAIPVYDPRFMTIFPRMWSALEKKHIEGYKRWGKIEGVPIQVDGGENAETLNRPTFGENLRFFWDYQFKHMYLRYFMWNFAGRQNDIQGMGDRLEGNWKSGIRFMDEARLGKQDVPDPRKNRADNSFFFLPLILGLVGFVFTLRRDAGSNLIISLLFIMTGIAILVYINQYFPQPRERDYSYAGSFYAFAIWMGLGILPLTEWLSRRMNGKLSAVLVTLVTLILVPGIMAQQGWNDHDRSGRDTSTAIAANYLNSCAPNAILFTNGDNDTFPLWYAQEVEGIRTDIRVVNLSLLNAGWCIDQMVRKAYDSDPVPISLTRDKYRTGSHDVTYILENDQLKNVYLDLKELFSILNSDDSKLKVNTPEYGMLDYFPSRKFMVTYDSSSIANGKLIPEKFYSRLDTLRWEIKAQAIEKNSLMILDLLATNNWKRPVYFAMTMGPDSYLGLDPYFHLEGLAYRVLPVKAKVNQGEMGEVNTGLMYDNVMNKFKWGNLNNPDVYLDEQNQRMIMNFRNMFSILANALIREGKMDSANKVLDRCFEIMPERTAPFNFFTLPLIEGYYKTGNVAKANGLSERMVKLMNDDLEFLFSFPKKDLKGMMTSFQEDLSILNHIQELSREFKQDALAAKIEPMFRRYYEMFINDVYQGGQ